MDTMTYLALKATGLPKNRIIGMGGALDSSRFKTYLSKALDKPANDIQGMVIGGHGDTTMIPLTRLASHSRFTWNPRGDYHHITSSGSAIIICHSSDTGIKS